MTDHRLFWCYIVSSISELLISVVAIFIQRLSTIMDIKSVRCKKSLLNLESLKCILRCKKSTFVFICFIRLKFIFFVSEISNIDGIYVSLPFSCCFKIIGPIEFSVDKIIKLQKRKETKFKLVSVF